MQRFIGNERVVELLRQGIAAGRDSHAYLVTGPRGVGRRTLAMELARAWNCSAEAGVRPCDACRACRLIERGVHPDVRVVRRNPERRGILLKPRDGGSSGPVADNVEFIQADAQLRPADGRMKVYVILNAEDLLQEAGNRLLKNVEEPTPYVRFVLTASDRGSVLPTIVSRCQEVRLQPVPRSILAAALEDTGVADAERAVQLAALADGRPGVALAAARDGSVVEVWLQDLRDLHAVLASPRLQRLQVSRGLAERWSTKPESVRETLRAWRSWWRDLVLLQGQADRRVVNDWPGERERLARAAAQVHPMSVRAALAQVQQALADLEANVNHRLVLDRLCLRLPALPSAAA